MRVDVQHCSFVVTSYIWLHLWNSDQDIRIAYSVVDSIPKKVKSRCLHILSIDFLSARDEDEPVT